MGGPGMFKSFAMTFFYDGGVLIESMLIHFFYAGIVPSGSYGQ